MQRFIDRVDDGIDLRQHSAIPESQHPIALVAQEAIPIGVIGRIDDMLTAVQLDDQRSLQTHEIADIATDGLLPAKLEAAQLPPSQVLP